MIRRTLQTKRNLFFKDYKKNVFLKTLWSEEVSCDDKIERRRVLTKRCKDYHDHFEETTGVEHLDDVPDTNKDRCLKNNKSSNVVLRVVLFDMIPSAPWHDTVQFNVKMQDVPFTTISGRKRFPYG